MDHGFARPKELWELSDGCVFMLMEMSAIDEYKDYVVKHLEGVSNLAYIDHFKHSHVMKEALWKSMKMLLNNLGKKKFRQFVELFLDPAFRCSQSDEHRNMAVAAQNFILELDKVLGQGIFKAVVESHDDKFVP